MDCFKLEVASVVARTEAEAHAGFGILVLGIGRILPAKSLVNAKAAFVTGSRVV